MILTINFYINGEKTTDLFIKNVDYIPNIGEYIHNKKDAISFYVVTQKECYFNDEYNTHIVMWAEKKNPLNTVTT